MYLLKIADGNSDKNTVSNFQLLYVVQLPGIIKAFSEISISTSNSMSNNEQIEMFFYGMNQKQLCSYKVDLTDINNDDLCYRHEQNIVESSAPSSTNNNDSYAGMEELRVLADQAELPDFLHD